MRIYVYSCMYNLNTWQYLHKVLQTDLLSVRKHIQFFHRKENSVFGNCQIQNVHFVDIVDIILSSTMEILHY